MGVTVGVRVGLSVPAGVDGVGAPGDVDSGPEGGGLLEAGPLGVGAEGPTDDTLGGGRRVVVSAGGGGADEAGAVGVGSPGLPASQSETVTVTVTAGAGRQAVDAHQWVQIRVEVLYLHSTAGRSEATTAPTSAVARAMTLKPSILMDVEVVLY